jgi:hypothetical protein
MRDWDALLHNAVGLILAEPPLVQICVYLALAFFALMIVEGLRMTFTPKRRLIRHLKLHAPDDPTEAVTQRTQAYETSDTDEMAVSFAPAASAAGPGDRPYRSTGRRIPMLRRTPREFSGEDGDVPD